MRKGARVHFFVIPFFIPFRSASSNLGSTGFFRDFGQFLEVVRPILMPKKGIRYISRMSVILPPCGLRSSVLCKASQKM